MKDSLYWDNLKKSATYPLIKNSEWSGAFPVSQITEKPDLTMKYKLLFNMTLWPKDSTRKKQINVGLAEIGRIINLHAASVYQKRTCTCRL